MQARSLELIVVAGDRPSLSGKNWLTHLKLDWQQIAWISQLADLNNRLHLLIKKHEEFSKQELRNVNTFVAKLEVCKDAVAKFCKARAVPFMINKAVDQELNRLMSCDILKPVMHSDWVAPLHVVVVPKTDGKFRVCRDYKVTINQDVEIDRSLLPRPSDLFGTLSGGKSFSKLDLSKAYQQLIGMSSQAIL